ncbi:MAG: hypothetical protein J6R08_05025, partial [Opitutales bacterium]|nr:hypothetical protein [Opitutales bacterium]
MTNIDDAWRAGNFYSKGGWNEISKNIINGGTSEDREKLYNAYKAWSTANPAPENKTWVGSVVNGVSNLIPLAIDMQPEALKVGGLTGGAGLAIGATTGPGAIATGLTAAGLGYKASMIEQSYKIGVADVYTSLRDDGIDDDTAKDIALIAGVPYGALEYFGKALAPVQRRLLGGRKLMDAIDKITDKKIKNKVLNFIAKKGTDVAITGTAETAVEGAQAGVVEGAAQSAKGEFDGKKIASAAWEEAKVAAPAMFGMAALGIPLDAAVSNVSKPKASTKETRHLDEMVKQGKDLISPQDLPEVASGVKPGETFKGNDGKTYRNIDGRAVPVDASQNAEEKDLFAPFRNEKQEDDLLEGDAQTDPYGNAQNENAQNLEKIKSLVFGKMEKEAQNIGEQDTRLPLIELAQMRQQLAEKKAQKKAQAEAMAKEDEELNRLAEADVAQKQFEEAKRRTTKKYKALSESQRAFNREKQELRKLLDSIPEEDEAARLDVIDNVDDVELLDDKDLDFAMTHGREWAYNEMQKREFEAEQKSHDTLLDVMERNGFHLPTPKAMRERGGSAELYGEIKDLHDNLYQAGGKGRHWLQKFFRDRYISVDDMVQALNADEGFSYNSTDEFISDFAENLAGHKTTRSNYSLADQQKQYDKNFNKKFKAIEKSANQFYKNAKHKAQVVVVNNRTALEKELGRKLPPNANVDAMRNGDAVYIVADKMESPRKAVSKLFHEYVGHYGLQGLLGDDFKPFIAYIRNKYKGTNEFEELKIKYQKARNSTDEVAESEAAEELISYLAEHGELSSASFMGRLLSRVRRALKLDGISDAYVNLLDEKDLRDAVIASRQWSSGKLTANNKYNVLSDVKGSNTVREIPDNDENFSLADAAGTKKNVFGDRAKNGDFDLANIDLNDYEGMDTREWINADWGQSWGDSADLEHIINDLEETGNLDSKTYRKIEGILQEGLPSTQARLRLIEAFMPKFKKAVYDSRKMADNYFYLMQEAAINVYGEDTLQNLAIIESALKGFSKVDKTVFLVEVVNAIHLENKKNYDFFNHEKFVKMALDELDDPDDIQRITYDLIHNPLKKKLSSEIVKKMIEAFNRNNINKEFDVLKNAIAGSFIFDKDLRNIVLASENEYVVANALLGLEERDGGLSRAEARAINNRLKNGIKTKDAFFALSRLINENCFYDKESEIKETLQNAFATWPDYFSDTLARSIINTFKGDDINKLYSEDSRHRPARDLRDAAYFDALEKGDYPKARSIIKERQKESEYNTDVEHTSRAKDIREFSLDPKLAKVYGEDAKAYGWGAYMTDDGRVTNYYRKRLANFNPILEIQKKNGGYSKPTVDQQTAIAMRTLFDSDKEYAEWLDKNFSKKNAQRYKSIIGKKWKLDDGKPATYEISHNMKNSEMLVLDDYIGEQNPEVLKKFRAMINGEIQPAYNKDGKFERFIDSFYDIDDEGEIAENLSLKMNPARNALEADLRQDNNVSHSEAQAMLSQMMLKYGIRGYKYKSGYGRNKNNVESWNYVNFEGGNALKRREVITRDKEGKIIPPSERFDSSNKDWNFSLINENTDAINLDVEDENREGKTLSALLEDAKDMHSKGVDMSKIFKQTGWELIDVGKDNPEWIYDIDEGEIEFPVGLELNTPVPLKNYIGNKKLFEVCPFLNDIKVEFNKFKNDRLHGVYDYEKKTIALSAKFDTHSIINSLLHETQHAIDRTNYIGGAPRQILAIINAAHTAKANINEPYQTAKARELSKEFYDLVKTTYKLTDEEIDGYWDDKENSADERYLSLTGEVMARNAGARHTIDRKNTPISTSEDANVKTKIHISEPVFKDIVDLFERMWDALGYGKGQKTEKTFAENNKGFSEGSSSYGIYDKRVQGEHRSIHSAQNYSLTEEEASEKERKRLEKEKEARAQITAPRARIVQATTDAFAPLAALERVLYGKVRGAEKSAWKMALMTKNLDQVMFHILRVGGITYDKATGEMKHRKGSIALESILKRVRGKNYKNFEHYALAKSAIERWAKLRKQKFYADKDFAKVFGFTLADARKWASEGTENTKAAFADLQKFFQSNRDFMLETGLISEKQHKAISEFKNYVPFFREGEDLDAETQEAFDRAAELNPGGRGMSARNSGIQKFIGSSRKTKNLIESIVNQARHVYDAGYKNIAMYRSLNLMRQIGMAQYLKQDAVDVRAKLAEMKRALEEAGVDVGSLTDEEIMQKVPIEAFADLTAQDEKTNDDIVAVRVNGTLRFYKVEDKELLVAVKNFGGEKFNVLWKVLTTPKNIMTWAITKLPEFAVRNLIRDTGSNSILFGGKTVAPYLGKTFKNLGKSAFTDEHMKKLWASGAGGGTWYSVNAGDIAMDFKDDLKSRALKNGKYIVRPFTWLLDQYERKVLIPSEQANRLTVMEQALANGASDMEAAFQAMDVLNFGMRGSGVWTGQSDTMKGTIKVLHAIVRITPFLNARIQGLYKLWRESGAQEGMRKQSDEFGAKNRTRAFIQSLSKAVLMRGMMLAGASVLYSIYANNSKDDDDEEWYKKLPAHDKLNYWHFYIGNNTIIRIPKPFEIGYLFGTIPEAMTDAMLQERPDTAKVLWEGLLNNLEFNPTSNPVLDTYREQISNEDSFTERPIVQQSDKSLPAKYQYDQDTSASAKAIANVFGAVGLDKTWLASPARVQNAIGNLLGGMTRYVTAASDAVVESLTDIEGGTSRYARESVFKAPYNWATRNTRTMNTRNAADFYELREQV